MICSGRRPEFARRFLDRFARLVESEIAQVRVGHVPDRTHAGSEPQRSPEFTEFRLQSREKIAVQRLAAAMVSPAIMNILAVAAHDALVSRHASRLGNLSAGRAVLFSVCAFIIQWLASERARKSVIPIGFWECSALGSILTLSYFRDLSARLGRNFADGVAAADLFAKSLLPLDASPCATSGERTAPAGIIRAGPA